MLIKMHRFTIKMIAIGYQSCHLKATVKKIIIPVRTNYAISTRHVNLVCVKCLRTKHHYRNNGN